MVRAAPEGRSGSRMNEWNTVAHSFDLSMRSGTKENRTSYGQSARGREEPAGCRNRNDQDVQKPMN